MTDKAPVTVEQGDVVLRKAILTFIVEEIGKPCSEGDMPDDRNDRLDAIIAAHRLQSTASLEEEIKRLREALEYLALNIRPEVPDDFAIETVAWTAAQHRAARTALEGGGS